MAKPAKKKVAKAKPAAKAKKPAKAAKPAKKVAKAAPKKAAKAKAAAKPAKKAAAPPPKADKAQAKSAGAKAVAPHKVTMVAKKPTGKDKSLEALKNIISDAAEGAQPAAEVEVIETAILTDAEGRPYCRVKDCDQLSTVDAYCRYHYLLHWKKIQVRKKILSEGKLERYIEELTARYPDKFLDMLRKDLRSEKEFLAAIQELELDENQSEGEFEDEAQTYIDEVRGISETTPAREDEEF